MAQSFDIERSFWDLLDKQHGVASVKQALSLGMPRKRIDTMLKRGMLRRVCHGVVAAAGAPQTEKQKMMIGVIIGRARTLDGGPSSAICGVTAGVGWDLLERNGTDDIHVLVTRQVDRREGYVFHRTGRLLAEEIEEIDGVPVTDPYRTYLDLCDAFPFRAVSILRRGLRRKILDRSILERRIEIESRQGRSGLGPAREALARTDPSAARAKSWLEDRFFDLIVQAGYPPPRRNVKVPGSFGFDWEIDLYDPEKRKGVEVSHTDIHSDPWVQAKDSRKLLDLGNQGIEVMVVTEETSDDEFLRAYRRLMGDPPTGF